VSTSIMTNNNRAKYKCPRCGHITHSLTRTGSISNMKCGAVGCSRSLSRRHRLE